MQYLKLYIVLILVFECGIVISQSKKNALEQRMIAYEMAEKRNDSLGNVSIVQDERLKELLKTDSTVNSKNPWFNGYRVQIFLGRSTEKERAFQVKSEFEELFPEQRAYVVYKAPDFRVRVGNFRSKIESIGLYKECLEHFPNCYPVKTKIYFTDLIPIEKDNEERLIVEEDKE